MPPGGPLEVGPNKPAQTSNPPSTASANAENDLESFDLLEDVPEEAVAFVSEAWCPNDVQKTYYGKRRNMIQNKYQGNWQQYRHDLVHRLQEVCRNHRRDPQPPPCDPLIHKSCDSRTVASVYFASHGSSGIVDLGASMSVIGQKQFADLCTALPSDVKKQMKEAPCSVSFRFGNSSTVTGKKAVFFPIGTHWIKVIIVPSNTPFLIAKSVFRSLGAIIDTGRDEIYFRKLDRTIPMTLSNRKLFCIDLQDH